MFDNQLFKLILGVLDAGLASLNQSQIETLQSYQPTQQGANSGPTIYLYKIGPDQNVGFPQRSSQQGFGSAAFTGSISGSILTVANVSAGALKINQQISGPGIPPNVVIMSLGTGNGGDGTYFLNQPLPAPIALQNMTAQAVYIRTEIQQKASLFQAMAVVTQNPANTESLTASDVANLGCYILQSVPAIQTLEAQGVGVLKIQSVRNPYFSDDRQRYEGAPSFDFTLTHKQTIILGAPVITETEFQLLRV